MSVLLTLPPHLLEKIQAILAADLHDELDVKLRGDLEKAQRDVERYDASKLEAAKDSPSTSGDAEGVDSLPSWGKEEGSPSPEQSSKPPPTIDEEVLIALSKWATSDIGPVILKRKDLDPLDYSLISLLAGTEVYVSPEALARLRAAENPDKPNPFLPAYLSPQPPSLGSEYRALTRNLSTALNILFSIFGSAGAVYAAGVGGAGYTRETSMLLAILAGVVVGIADGVLVWIFSARVGKGREEGRKLGRQMLRGSAATPGGGKGTDDVGEGGKGAVAGDTSSGAVAGGKKAEIRLRRRAVGEQNP